MGDAQRVRVGSWNLRFGRADDSLVAAQDLDLLCLQECTPQAFERFRSHFDWGFSAMDPAWLRGITTTRSHGVAVLGRSSLQPSVLPPMASLLAPEKLLAVEVEPSDGEPVTVASYHAYAGRKGDDELDKPRLTSQVASWLGTVTGAAVLAMDANSPWVDHPDPESVECCFDVPGAREYERHLLHPTEKVHRLEDVLRTWLAARPEELAAIRAERPSGPLAVSHRTGRSAARPGNPRRYGHIYASPELGVADVRYLYDEAISAGSDHAMVTAAFIPVEDRRPR